MADIKVLALVGSLRAASINRQLAELAAESAPDGVTVTVYEGLGGGLGELPFYNEDIDTDDAPAAVAALRAAAGDADAALVVTPEYNGSIPGVLKNAIDWLSRPYGNGALKDKPLAVVGAALGQYGGVWAHDETANRSGSPDRGWSSRSRCRCPPPPSTASTRGRARSWSPRCVRQSESSPPK